MTRTARAAVPPRLARAKLCVLFSAVVTAAAGCGRPDAAHENVAARRGGHEIAAPVADQPRGPARDTAASAEPARSPPPSAAVVGEPPTAAALATSPPPAAARVRIVHASGEHSALLVAGIGERLRTFANSELVVDMVNGARARIGADAEVWLLAFAPTTLVVLSGSVFVQLLPEGNREGRSALTLATADAAVRVPGNAELWLEQRVECPKPQLRAADSAPPARSYVALIRGQAELLRLGKAGAVTSVALAAAAARAHSREQPKVVLASTVGEARTGAAAYFRKRDAPAASEGSDAALVRAIEAVAAEREQGATLLSQISPAAAQRARARGAALAAGELVRVKGSTASEANAPDMKPGAAMRAADETEAASVPPGAASATILRPGAAASDVPSRDAGSAAPLRPGAAASDVPSRDAGSAAPLAADVRRYQRALTEHAQRQHDLERALALSVVQSLSGTLLRCTFACAPAAAKCAALEHWQTRFGSALGHDRAQP